MSQQQASWQKEREAKQKQKEWENRGNEHSNWMNQRDTMIKKKEATELAVKEAEASAPEFMKKLGTMKEKKANQPKKKPEDDEPTIADLDDGTDIPPWHRAGASEKPEWVELLLLAAAKEAEEDDDVDEHVFVAPAPSSVAAATVPTLPPKPKEPDQPAWMKKAINLKSVENSSMASSMNNNSSTNNNSTAKLISATAKEANRGASVSPNVIRPARKISPKHKTLIRSKTADEDDSKPKPEWMKSAAKLKKKKAKAPADTPASKPEVGNNIISKPAWMSKLKQKATKEEVSDSIDESQSKQQTPQYSAEAPSDDNKPAWTKQKQKSKPKDEATAAKEAQPDPSKTSVEHIRTATVEKEPEDDNAQQSQPAWMKHKLKPRQFSARDLQDSKVQSKLEKKSPLKRSSIVMAISKETLESELGSSKVKVKLAKQPSVRDMKKSPLKSTEMEWMKKKLKPRQLSAEGGTKIEDDALDVSSQSQPAATNKNTVAGETKAATKSGTKIAPSTESHQDNAGKPAWMKHKLKPRVSVVELQSSKVQEKLEQKKPMRKSSIILSKQELTDNKVTEKLKQRPSLRDTKKSPLKKEEMAWTKLKLRPRTDGVGGKPWVIFIGYCTQCLHIIHKTKCEYSQYFLSLFSLRILLQTSRIYLTTSSGSRHKRACDRGCVR